MGATVGERWSKRIHSTVVSAVIAVLGLIAVGGCALPGVGSSGPTPTDTARSALKSLLASSPIHYSGTVEMLGVTYTVDLTSDQKGRYQSTLDSHGAKVEVIVDGANVYRKGNMLFWAEQVSDTATQRVYASGWVKVGGGNDQRLLAKLTDADVERDLRDHFTPSRSSTASVGGTHARQLSGSQGDLYVTASNPARVLSFASSAAYVSPSGLKSIRFSYTNPATFAVTAPAPYINPDDHSTWPAEYQLTKDSEGPCGDSSCTEVVVLQNVGGAPVGQATVTVTLTDTGGKELGRCTANIPPVAHGQNQTVTCAISGPGWAAFTASGGGSYRSSTLIYNPPYDG